MKLVVEKIKEEIASEPAIKTCHITVKCDSSGIVILVGNVASFYQKQMAQEAARRAINNKIPYLALTVQNNLCVR